MPDLATPPPAEATPTPLADPLLIDLAEAARRLSVSTKTAKRMAADGTLPGVVKVRRRRLVSLAALRAWIAEGCPALEAAAPVPRRRRSR